MSVDTRLLRDADTTRAELYHCASMHGTYEQQRSVIDRLETLGDGDLVDEVSRRAWAHRLTPAADDDWCEQARAKYAQFCAWAATNDRSLEPGFETRTISPITDEGSYEVIKFPVLCLAVYADDEPVAVAPSTDPVTGETYTVEDCLTELEATAETGAASAASSSSPGA